MSLESLDQSIIHLFRKVSLPLARISLFIVFFWFGFLKIIGESPASPLVEELFNSTIPIMSFGTFIIFFGLLECLIGILFLIKGSERFVLPLLLIHMLTTLGPLVLLPESTWSGFLVPTMEGQYIIKNLVIIALATGIAAHLRPLRLKNS